MVAGEQLKGHFLRNVLRIIGKMDQLVPEFPIHSFDEVFPFRVVIERDISI
jgi:hypothetical protein